MAKHDYEPHPGQSIEQAANALQVRAQSEGREVTMAFNGIELAMGPDTDPKDVVADYWAKTHKQAEAYRNSAEGKATAEKTAQHLALMQKTMADGMARLPQLDFTDLHAVIEWLAFVQDASHHTGVQTPRQEIIETFAAHGFLPSVNCGEDYNEDDRENVARYLIGQALAGLQSVGAIHHIFHDFAADWHLKFDAAKV